MTPGRFRSTNRGVLVKSIASCRVFSAHLRTPGVGYVLRSMSFAPKPGSAPGRVVSLQTRWSGLDRSGIRNAQRALPLPFAILLAKAFHVFHWGRKGTCYPGMALSHFDW